MPQRHLILIGLLLSVGLLMIATWNYPGGSYDDPNSEGFQWTKNYISNLFAPKAVNGADNTARVWAILSMLFFSLSLSLFFWFFAERLPQKSAVRTVKYVGAAGMLCALLVVTPLHDPMVTASSTLFLLCLFYITVFVFRTRLHLFKVLCAACMLIFYYTLYLYGARHDLLPLMQKVTMGSVVLLVLGLSYFTQATDFDQQK